MPQNLKNIKSWYVRGNNAWDGVSGLDQDLVHLDNHFGGIKFTGAIAAGSAATANAGTKGIAQLFADGTYAVTNMDASGSLVAMVYSATAGLLASDGFKLYINTGSSWSSPSAASATSVPSANVGQIITVTAPHLRQMVWNGTAYVRAPWHQPGMVQYSIDNPASIPGYLPVRGDVVYSQSNYPDLIARLGLSGAGNFSLVELRGEFIRCLDNGRGVDAGRVSGAAQASQNLSHNHSTLDQSGNPAVFVAFNASVAMDASGYAQTFGFSDNTFSIGSSGGAESRPRNVALPAWVSY